jgi:hypothetical protein
MRALSMLAGLIVAFFLGAFIEHTYDAPIGYLTGPWFAARTSPTAPADTGNTYVPPGMNARGVEDAPRADVPQGPQTDFERCVKTMVMRREPEAEARTVCRKIINGISG